MPTLSELPSDLKRKKLIRALIRSGFQINSTGGKGSHIKIIWPQNQKSVVVPFDVSKNVLRYLLKEIEVISGITWENIKNQL